MFFLTPNHQSTEGLEKKVKFSHTRYRALGPELIPVYRQSARRPAVTSVAFTGSTHLIPAYYAFADPERMKG